ncbi:MAG: hypothetical protein K2N06_06500 [Oscillospiraceae bacterium]|nr:hypothetical protein [Oscillospiraceae bacterium]
MGKVYRKRQIEGVTIPAIIHNWQYFWHNMAVYEDGTISCWERTDLCDVPWQMSRGWLMARVPDGKALSVHHCCSLEINNGDWNFDNNEFVKFIKNTVRSMNPEMANIFQMTEREKAIWKERHICFSASPTPCKVKEGFGYDLMDGDSVHIFVRDEGKITLTELNIYSDETFSVDTMSDKTFTLYDIKKLFADNTLCTAPKNGERVVLGALGEADCKLICDPVPDNDKLSEIKNLSLRVQNKPDGHELCIRAYHAYLVEPTDFYKEKLREAYEAVPEHERMYLGDMDTRDSDFIRILYTDEKREV